MTTTLHIISSSPYSSDALQRCLAAASENDAVMLLGDAVYGHELLALTLKDTAEKLLVYVLEADLNARNVATDSLQKVNYDELVALAAEHSKTVSWF